MNSKIIRHTFKRDPQVFDRAKIFSEINLRECTPPTRAKLIKLRRKKVLTIDEQIYIGACRDYMKLAAHRRENICSNQKERGVKLRLEREWREQRKQSRALGVK